MHPIVHINGLPGIGKLTIARRLVDILNESSKTSDRKAAPVAKLVHNHLLIDPASAVLERDQQGYQDLRREIRQVVFKTLIGNESTWETTYIFTDFQSGNEAGSAVCAEYKALAAARGCPFVPILLTCSETENVKRATQPERRLFGKLTNVKMIQSFRKKANSVHRFEREAFWLELDVSDLSVEESARKLARHISASMWKF